jgi:ribosome biogenesis GTPase / thiamine phosphate phosphatase
LTFSDLTLASSSPGFVRVNPTLVELGWTEFETGELKKLAPAPEIRVGRVMGQHRREWDVRTSEGSMRAVLAGRRWGEGRFDTLDVQPVVGDWVLCRTDPTQGGPPLVEQVLPRRTLLARGAAGRNGKGQVVAANVDFIAVVSAFAEEDARDSVHKRSLNARRIERYLTAIRSGGARPLVLLNKADLTTRGAESQSEFEARLPGVPVLLVSPRTGAGKAALLEFLRPRETVGFVGLSGVGKSSLVNWLTGGPAQATQAERRHDGRGRHTTTHRELFFTPEGALVIDTPGMREFSLNEADEDDLTAFEDIEAWAKECRFADCGHKDEPGCRVSQALRDGELVRDRLENYQTLREEIHDKRRFGREKARRTPLKTRPKRA